MQKKRIISLICAVVLIATTVFSYINLPDTLILYKDRSWNSKSLPHLKISDNSIETVQNAIVARKTGDYEASLSIFGIPYKSVTVKVIDEAKVIAGGCAIGIRLYADSLIVVAVGRVNESGKSPAEKAGIKEGDVIISVDGEKTSTPEEFSNMIAQSEGDVVLEVKSGEEIRKISVAPEVSEYDGTKRVGLWVRDSTAGVGTLTYVDPVSMSYGALGHGVSDADTGVKFSVKEGTVERCLIGSVVKGEKGSPGELKGMFLNNAEVLGDIKINDKTGIFGRIKTDFQGETVPLGHKSEIKKGKAYIRTSLDGKNIDEYEIEILKVSKNTKNPSKGLVIKVTDQRLLEKTGGIVQ
ncbi:MAG: PDZ domain-containing protein, partial [Clostridia bacterium]|nr:PDZ domain-containing protein [Clostridia bacterium]